jgi:hypothetical protein
MMLLVFQVLHKLSKSLSLEGHLLLMKELVEDSVLV